MQPTSEPREQMPLPGAEFQILLALLDGPCHGHGIKNEVGHRTEGEVVLGPGTLYTAVKRMLGRRLIEECQAPSHSGTDERRRYYRITAQGRRAAKAEAERMIRLVGMAADKRLISWQLAVGGSQLADGEESR
ncbi:MAG: helix-turn-helix transcriptional regulator [Acidobacteriota bacterium]